MLPADSTAERPQLLKLTDSGTGWLPNTRNNQRDCDYRDIADSE